MTHAGDETCAWCAPRTAQVHALNGTLAELRRAYDDMRIAWLAERAEVERLTRALATLQLGYRFEEARADRAERRVGELESESPT